MIPDSLEMKTIVNKGHKPYLLITGPPSNYMGIVKGIGVEVLLDQKIVNISKYAIRWHPFSSVNMESDWPLVIDTADFPPGTYTVRCWTRNRGFVRIGEFVAPVNLQ